MSGETEDLQKVAYPTMHRETQGRTEAEAVGLLA